jgi:hypothetical protein
LISTYLPINRHVHIPGINEDSIFMHWADFFSLEVNLGIGVGFLEGSHNFNCFVEILRSVKNIERMFIFTLYQKLYQHSLFNIFWLIRNIKNGKLTSIWHGTIPNPKSIYNRGMNIPSDFLSFDCLTSYGVTWNQPSYVRL